MEQSKRCTKDLLQAGGASAQLRPEPAPHRVCQYSVIKRSKFSQFKAHTNIPCLNSHTNPARAAQITLWLPSWVHLHCSTESLVPAQTYCFFPVTNWAGRGPGYANNLGYANTTVQEASEPSSSPLSPTAVTHQELAESSSSSTIR